MSGEKPSKEEDFIELVFRITTNQYHDDNGVYYKRSLKYLKRKCHGFNILDEDCANCSAEEVIPRIVNFHTVKDGIYTVDTVNHKYDFESGYLDDYDYKLVEYKE